jgi:hypothetical protein
MPVQVLSRWKARKSGGGAKMPMMRSGRKSLSEPPLLPSLKPTVWGMAMLNSNWLAWLGFGEK